MENSLQKGRHPFSPRQPNQEFQCAVWQNVQTQHTGGNGFLCIQPPWLSLSCVCLCFPSKEPGVFPLNIFSPRTLDYPGIQSWAEVSGTVRLTTRLAFRSVSFWSWFQRMGCAVVWGLTPLSGGLAGPHLSLCCPMSPSAQMPPPPHPLSTPSVLPSFLFSPDRLPSQWPMAFCPFRTGVNILFLLLKQQIANILDFVCHSISVVIYQLCCFSPQKGKGNTSAKAHDCVPIKLYLQKQVTAIFGPQAIVFQLSFQSMQGSRFDWCKSLSN